MPGVVTKSVEGHSARNPSVAPSAALPSKCAVPASYAPLPPKGSLCGETRQSGSGYPRANREQPLDAAPQRRPDLNPLHPWYPNPTTVEQPKYLYDSPECCTIGPYSFKMPQKPTYTRSRRTRWWTTSADLSKIDTYPTDARIREVCQNFTNGRCTYGRSCHRIHVREAFRQACVSLPSDEVQSSQSQEVNAADDEKSCIVKLPSTVKDDNSLSSNGSTIESPSSPSSTSTSSIGHNEFMERMESPRSFPTGSPGNYRFGSERAYSTGTKCAPEDPHFDRPPGLPPPDGVYRNCHWGSRPGGYAPRRILQCDLPVKTQSLLPRISTTTSLSKIVHDHITVELSSGFEVLQVATGFESPWVYLGNIPSSATPAKIKKMMSAYGEVQDVRMPNDTKHLRRPWVLVQMSNHAEASSAIAELHGSELRGAKLTARLPIGDVKRTRAVFRDTAVRITWEMPSRVAYGGYSSVEHAEKAILAARIPFKDSIVGASIYRGIPAVGRVTVRFEGVPLGINDGDMERFAHPDDIVWERPNYTDFSRAVHGIQRHLQDAAELAGFDVLPPPYRRGQVLAWAHFESPGEAKTACDHLNNRKPVFTGRTKITSRHVHTLSYRIHPEKYFQLRADIHVLRRSLHLSGYDCTMSILDKIPQQPTIVRISSEDLRLLGQTKAEFENVLNGEVVRIEGKPAWDGYFGRAPGINWLVALESAHPGVTILKNTSRRTIRLFGYPRLRASVRSKILQKLDELRSQQIRVIPLKMLPIGLFVSRDLVMLQEELGPENVVLDMWNHSLKIRGDDMAYQAAQEAVRRAVRRPVSERRADVVECPVCFDRVTNPITLHCGHTWCRDCLSGYLTASIDNKFFPLTCLGNEGKCEERISLDAARQILSGRTFDAVINAAYTLYVQSRPNEFHYCPSADCEQIYRTAPRGVTLQCPSCLIHICPNCHSEAHDGLECPDGGDDLFNEWVRDNDVKNCPGCRVPIERAEGCNHMTCTQCQTHICWVCLETFPRGEGIYDHMHNVHGGIGLGPIDY